MRRADKPRDLIQSYRTIAGSGPLVISIPHAGTEIPEPLRHRLSGEGLKLPDTDWRVDRLYGFLADLDIPTLIASHSRLVVDLNRPPDNAPLYQGQGTPGLVPLTSFAGMPLYREAQEPDEAEIEERLEHYWRPYHLQLAKMLEAAKDAHGFAILWDAHSIRARVPNLFKGRLRHLNWGTNSGESADPRLARYLHEMVERAGAYSSIIDGRFKGGYITRHYGDPSGAVHAIQLELSFDAYLDEEKTEIDPERLTRFLPLLRALVGVAMAFNLKR